MSAQIKNPLAPILYRQLLKWTNKKCVKQGLFNKKTSPFSEVFTGKPFTHYTPPYLTCKILKDDGGKVKDLSPPVDLQLPINSASTIRSTIKTLFKLNRNTTIQSHITTQTDLGFSSLKKLNQWAVSLQLGLDIRNKNLCRDNVKFKIGQILQHTNDNWRGVVTSWHRDEDTDVVHYM